jgi:large subunit ribosomal protein L13
MSQAIRKAVKTTRPTKTGLNRDIYVLDASKEPVGRLATKAATILMGKNRADYAPDVDMGGVVVIINADKLVFTGQKPERKAYFWHTGRSGKISSRLLPEQMKKDSTRPLYLAIRNMLPKNRHKDIRMNNRVYIYKDDNHKFTQELISAN